MDDDSVPAPQGGDRYREIASSLRALLPTMKNEEVRSQLSMLAIEYDKLAQCMEAVSESLQHPPAPRSG